MGGDDLEDESFLVEKIIEGNSDSNDDGDQEPAKKRRKKQLSLEEILIETGRRLAALDPTEQATFLNTAMRHFALKEKSTAETDDAPDDGGAAKDILQTHWLLRKKSEDGNLMEEIRSVVSLQKLKHWKGKSPCVLIACFSARRAVAILKDIAELKVRVSKLFPKNGSVEEQREKLAVPIAVGTPHRLRQLKASWQSTSLVVLDAALSNKQFTVCTLPETAQDCMAFLRESVVPEMAKRKSCRLLIV